jgi:hypothetical protein
VYFPPFSAEIRRRCRYEFETRKARSFVLPSDHVDVANDGNFELSFSGVRPERHSGQPPRCIPGESAKFFLSKLPVITNFPAANSEDSIVSRSVKRDYLAGHRDPPCSEPRTHRGCNANFTAARDFTRLTREFVVGRNRSLNLRGN